SGADRLRTVPATAGDALILASRSRSRTATWDSESSPARSTSPMTETSQRVRAEASEQLFPAAVAGHAAPLVAEPACAAARPELPCVGDELDGRRAERADGARA